MEQERIPVPKWCQKFRCQVIKAGTSLQDRQLIAGREQARQEGVQRQKLSDTVRWFRNEARMAQERMEKAGVPVVLNKGELLRSTYIKTGKNIASDGTMVCISASHAINRTILLPSQDNWCKVMNNLAELIIRVPDKAVLLVCHMERDAKPTPGSFKCLDGMVDQEDFESFVERFIAEPKHTVDKLRHLAEKIIRGRWWKWVLLHPDLGEDLIHPSRRMFTQCHSHIRMIFLSPHRNCWRN